MLPIKFTGPGRMIRVRMIPPQQIKSTLGGCTLSRAEIVRRNREPVAGGIVPPVDQREQCANLPPGVTIGSQHRAATFMGIIPRAVVTDILFEICRKQEHVEIVFRKDAYTSSQKRSLKYFVPESGKIVTITARSSGLREAAT